MISMTNIYGFFNGHTLQKGNICLQIDDVKNRFKLLPCNHINNTMDKPIVTVIGYVLILLGFLAVILSMIGLRLKFLAFLEFGGPLIAFIIKMCMIMVGFILMYISKTIARDREEQESLLQ